MSDTKSVKGIVSNASGKTIGGATISALNDDTFGRRGNSDFERRWGLRHQAARAWNLHAFSIEQRRIATVYNDVRRRRPPGYVVPRPLIHIGTDFVLKGSQVQSLPGHTSPHGGRRWLAKPPPMVSNWLDRRSGNVLSGSEQSLPDIS